MSNSISEKTFSFIGAGRMAEAIFSGLIKSGMVSADSITIADVSEKRVLEMKNKYGLRPAASDTSASLEKAAKSDIIILAVKPQNARDVLSGVKAYLKAGHIVISIMGGVPLRLIESYITEASVIRVMPNAPMLVGEGAAGIALGSRAGSDEGELVMQIFDCVGTACLCPEYLIDPITSVSGCGPAFAYMFIEALADGGVEMGLTRELAYKLAAQTLIGAGQMVLQTGEHPGKLKDDVCSPGGSTIAGVHALENGGFRGTVMNAVAQAKKRMEDVGKNA